MAKPKAAYAAKGSNKAPTRRKQTDTTFRLIYSSVKLMNLPMDSRDAILGAIRARDLGKLDSVCGDHMSQAVHDSDQVQYFTYASVKAMYSKLELISSPQGGERALESWYKAERICSRANRRIRLTSLGIIGSTYLPYLEKAKCIIARILGDRFPFTEFASAVRHGPGVAIGLAGLATSGAFKYASSSYTVSPSCANLFRDLVITDSTWFNLVTKNRTKLDVVGDADKLTFVEKNWKTKRGISIGPIGNLFCQLGIGEVMVNRLKRVGIDLSNQENNQQAAYSASVHEGSYGDGYVTLDLSMASDTLNRELVKYLLPDEWYRVLDCTRAACTVLPNGSTVRLSKFSAMGNGFTFPLETLVFYALSLACMMDTVHRNKLWVYGDDIIVPRGSALLLSEVLRWCGFVVNSDKSFYHGDFYESCGADYLGGVPVRPVYWKRGACDPRHIATIVNGLRASRDQLPSCLWIDNVRRHLLSSCSTPLLFGPPIQGGKPFGKGRLIVHVDDRVVTTDRSLWKLRYRDSILQCKVWKTTPRRKPVGDDFAYLQARHGLRSDKQERTLFECDDGATLLRSKNGALTVPIRATNSGTHWISVS